jgi:hypothetical protein
MAGALSLKGKMRVRNQRLLAVSLVLAMPVSWRAATGQVSPLAPGTSVQVQASQTSSDSTPAKDAAAVGSPVALPLPMPDITLAPGPLFAFKTSDIKFDLLGLMKTLRDSKHEGWVLAAYPDPKTSRPLIGAGFSLDVTATEHVQRDPLNPHLFIEPSSAQLWQAAELDPERLQAILNQFDRHLKAWKQKTYRRKIRTHSLTPQLTADEATKLLRISTLQAIHNARAYCRDFDQLTASQQMALSQLVFQMGVNLEEFVQFLGALNGDVTLQQTATTGSNVNSEREHWKTVQQTLIQSQWAKRYTSRAVVVIAMFDPDYAEDPKGAERRVGVTLHPPAKHHPKKSRGRKTAAAASVRCGTHLSPPLATRLGCLNRLLKNVAFAMIG